MLKNDFKQYNSNKVNLISLFQKTEKNYFTLFYNRILKNLLSYFLR